MLAADPLTHEEIPLMSDNTIDHDPMTGQQLRELGQVAHQSVEQDCDRLFARADLADAYVTCAADLLDRGEYTHALQLARRAGEVHTAYSTLHAALGGEP